jgi:hypothetical protein
MTRKPFLLLTLILAFVFATCNKATPSGFWKNYRKDLLVKNISDQGPYGGHRAIYWKSDKAKTFTSTNVLDFARKNGWTLIDSSKFNEDQTKKWTYNRQAVFPLTSTGFSDTVLNNTQLEHFPRWFGGQIKMFKFKTGWVTIEPGTDDSNEENGFVIIDSEEEEMAVYHLWGE